MARKGCPSMINAGGAKGGQRQQSTKIKWKSAH
jgi:hypothetical protein